MGVEQPRTIKQVPAVAMRRAQNHVANFLGDKAAALNTSALMGIVTVIIAAVVGLALLAALAPSYMTNLATFVGVFTDANTTTGSSDADVLLPTFGLLLAFAGLFAIVGIGIAQARLRKN